MSFEGFKKASDDYGYLIEQIVRFNKCKVCVEVGVAYGTTTNYICKAAMLNGGKVFGFDIWEKHGEQLQFPIFSDPTTVLSYLTSNGHTNVKLYKVDSKTPQFKKLLNQTVTEIDFAFIDGDHSYNGIKNDFDIIYPKLSKNGIIIFHDTAVIDGCREFMIDLRTKYNDGTFDLINFPYGGERRFGLSVLVKRSMYDVDIDEVCGSPSSPEVRPSL